MPPQGTESSIAYQVPAKLTADYGLLVDLTINGKAGRRMHLAIPRSDKLLTIILHLHRVL